MRQDEREPFVAALEQARRAAYPPGQYIGQESFMTAEEIRRLARRAWIGPQSAVLDLCCGVAGPGRLIVAERGCSYLGVDYSADALSLARERARDLPCRFRQQHVPPRPGGRFDVVLLLETMLAFPDKAALVREVSGSLRSGGRFAFTVEAGAALTDGERARMPDADTVWPIDLADLIALLERAGLTVTWQREWTQAHRATATALLHSFRAHAPAIAAVIGPQALDELLEAHRLWSEWLGLGRIRKYAVVAHRS